MNPSIKLVSNYEYKRQFLPEIPPQVLNDDAKLQLYTIESYLKDIVIPVPPYRTSFNFLIFVTKGYIHQQLETKNFMIGQNQVLNIKQGSITRTLELSEDVEGFYIIYEHEIITNINLTKSDLNFFFTAPFVVLKPQATPLLTQLFGLLQAELQDKEGIKHVCEAIFTAILIKIIGSGPEKPQVITRDLEISYLFREQVQQYHIEHKEVCFYAKKMSLSETYLNKCVKRTTGKPPKQWINEISILHSQILLQDVTKEIAEVAYELNYQSASYFSRVFRKVTGISPSRFRAEIHQPRQ